VPECNAGWIELSEELVGSLSPDGMLGVLGGGSQEHPVPRCCPCLGGPPGHFPTKGRARALAFLIASSFAT